VFDLPRYNVVKSAIENMTKAIFISVILGYVIVYWSDCNALHTNETQIPLKIDALFFNV